MSDQPLVAMCVHSLECGGVERITVNMVQHLVSRGHRVDLLLRLATGEFIGEIPPSVRVIQLGRSHLAAVFRLAAYLRRERPRNLLAFMYPQNELALAARWLAGTRVRVLVSVRSMLSGQEEIVNLHGRLARRLHAACVRFLARVCYRRADGVITVSDGAAKDVADVTGLPRSRITVIRNPVLRPRLFALAAEPAAHPWLIDAGPPVIVGVGRLHRIKDFATLVEAFALLRPRREARLLILGDGPERAALQRLARERGVAADVDLPGFAANPYAAMRAASVLALTSRFDALPAVLIEALALGVPVVATDCASGPAEILRGGRHGELVPAGDAPAVAAAILRVLEGRSAAKPVDEEWRGQFREQTAMQRYLEVLLDGTVETAGSHAIDGSRRSGSEACSRA